MSKQCWRIKRGIVCDRHDYPFSEALYGSLKAWLRHKLTGYYYLGI